MRGSGAVTGRSCWSSATTNRHEVFELFRSADACVVSSLHDGMNLVAKEFVAAREDNMGVLVLSSFTGASREMLEALIVNPYDTEEMALAIDRALDHARRRTDRAHEADADPPKGKQRLSVGSEYLGRYGEMPEA